MKLYGLPGYFFSQTLILFWGFTINITTVSGQEIQQVLADFDKKNSLLVIYYDLVSAGNKDERYKVRLFYSQDKGKNFSDTLRFVNGDVGDAIQPGTGKKIQWNYFVENADFDGKNVFFRVEAERDWNYESQRLSYLQGPENAFRSLLLPGWGDAKVRGKDRKYWWITAGTLGLVGSGVFFALNSRNQYDKYKAAEKPDEAQSNYDKAKSQGKIATILLVAGGAAWLCDIALVAVKGFHNQKKQKEVKQILNQEITLRWQLNPWEHHSTLALKFKF